MKRVQTIIHNTNRSQSFMPPLSMCEVTYAIGEAPPRYPLPVVKFIPVEILEIRLGHAECWNMVRELEYLQFRAKFNARFGLHRPWSEQVASAELKHGVKLK